MILAARGHLSERIRAVPEDLLSFIDARGEWGEYEAIHGGPLLNEAKKREEEVLAAVGLAQIALGYDKAVLLTYPPKYIGYSSGKGGYFNAAAYLAARASGVLVSFDVHFPWGVWDLHLRLGFPLLAIYGGPEGPPPAKVARRSVAAAAVPLPPGAADSSASKLLSLLKIADVPLVVELGFDFYHKDPAGYFFFTSNAYYELGKLLGEAERAYVVLDCVEGWAERPLRAFLAGFEGGGGGASGE
ncbi:MAG: histone deacetylase, partial [Thermoproteus sp.]|nr:histone deacetylase [Thermoproteus sp.]